MTKEEFIANQDEWSGHRSVLWDALEATKHFKLPVLELGAGHGSTPYLRQYCKDNGLELFSYDYNEQWAKEMSVTHVTNWDAQVPWRKEFSVALVDESPGEHRKESLKNLMHVKIVVIHDSEPIGHNGSDYRVRPEFTKYQYVVDVKAPSPSAWTTMLSNFINLTELFLK